MITRELREAIGRAVAEEGRDGAPDPGLRPGAVPGQYASSVAFSLGGVDAAERIAARLNEAESWIETAEVTGRGFVTITVTPEALRRQTERIAEEGPDCVRSDALKGLTFPESPAAGEAGEWESAPTWEEAHARLAAEVTASLARAAGAGTHVAGAGTHVAGAGAEAAGSGTADTKGTEVMSGTEAKIRSGENEPAPLAAVAFAGRDAVRFSLVRTVPGSKITIDQRKMAGHHLGNPAYAVRYAHARAASGVRWAAVANPDQAVPQRPSADPGELALLDALSWLPERVATAARRGRPDEFARYLERVAGVTLDALTASPKGGRAPGSDRLALARAARTGLAAGLELLGVNAPERLLPNRPEKINVMSRVAHPAGPRYADVLPADHPPAPPADLNALDEGIWPRHATRDKATGALTIGGLDVRDLARDFGTPVFVADEDDVRERCREYAGAFGDDGSVYYAAKAFCSRAVLRWVTEEGLGVDVCTEGELEVALSAGVSPEKITLHGNNKLPSEIERAVTAGVGHIVVDSFEEIARVAFYADAHGKRPSVLVRVTTGVEAHTHEFMATAHDDQKFGFSLMSGAADEAVRRIVALKDLDFKGLHSHIGSQIFDTAGFEVAAHRVAELAARIHAEHGVSIEELDLGGGFGIAYTPEDDPPDVIELAKSLRAIVAAQCAAAGLSQTPKLTIEPGRGVIGPSTVTLYEVGTIKDVDGLRAYVSVDGGMSDNIRTALYDAEYTVTLASRASDAKPMLSRVVGRHCESGDIVVRHCYLPEDLAPGDLLAVAATGAYCWSLASNYNHLTRPGVVAVRDGAAREIVRRETLDDLLALDVG